MNSLIGKMGGVQVSGKEATTWFGNTSCATCGDSRCVRIMQADYDKHRYESEDEGY